MALRHRLESVESRAGIKFHLVVPQTLTLSPGIGEGLYHIAQEALNNALKHSSESEVQITISLTTNGHAGEAVVLEIRDNGQGFIFETVDRSGMGLANMKHRAEEYHGILSIVSSPGKGTTIRVEIPLPSESLV